MNNLIIGQHTQLAYYFPLDWERVGSRDLNLEQYKDRFYDRVYICFAEQRTFLSDSELFLRTNVDYTKQILDFFVKRCRQVIWYSTTELWNNCDGPININTPFNYQYTPYIHSKELMTNYIFEHYPNVIVLFPFNFNSPYRKPGFLFSKIFDSILHETPIQIGDTHFYRDLVHPKWVAERSQQCQTHEIIGSGRLTYVNDFIRELYQTFQLDYRKLVTENIEPNRPSRKTFYLTGEWVYQNLILDTVNDLHQFKSASR